MTLVLAIAFGAASLVEFRLGHPAIGTLAAAVVWFLALAAICGGLE